MRPPVGQEAKEAGVKEALLAQLDAAYTCFERSTRNLSEEDSTFSPTDGAYTAAQ